MSIDRSYAIDEQEISRAAMNKEIIESRLFFLDGPLPKWKTDSGEDIDVDIVDILPLTYPKRYFSVVNMSGGEIFFLNDLQGLNQELSDKIRSYMDLKGFCFHIIDIVSIVERQESRCFQVKTLQGEKTIYMDLDSWPTVQDDGSLLLKDVFGDIYLVNDLANLSQKSREAILAGNLE